jgi:cyclophilin family peptidyl-prolyl cis-trans isomerase
MELYFDIAPLTVINFIDLAKDEYYNGIIFHRVIPNFVAQAGDPEGTGWGGPGYEIRCEYSSETYRRGTVGIATSGKDTGGSQFFITHTPLPHLDGRYTVMGQVLSGMDVVDQIVKGDTIKEVLIHEGAYQ